MGCLPYFKFYPGDWTIGVVGLTLAERGAYVSFLAWSWEHGPLPLDDGHRARLLGVGVEEMEGLWPALEPFWRQGARGFTNKRLEDERKRAKKRTKKAQESAAARWS